MDLRRKITTGAATGLSLLALGGCPDPVNIVSISLPAETPSTGQRRAAIYENDVQIPSYERLANDKGHRAGVFEFDILPGYEGQRFAPHIVPIKGKGADDEESLPFSVGVGYNVNPDGSLTGGELSITDKFNPDVPFRDGAEYEVSMQGVNFVGHGLPSDTERFVFEYNIGNSPGNLSE